MEGNMGGYTEVAVPVSTFTSLRTELTRECGPLPTIHALHAAGYAAGAEAVAAFSQGLDDGATALGQDAFWARLQRFFSRRGWGTLTHTHAGDAVGLLTTTDWVEATPEEPADDGSCSFSTGFLSGFLSEVAGGPIAVLEVSCRTRGDDSCVYAFGSESAVHDLYGQLLDGVELDGALAAL